MENRSLIIKPSTLFVMYTLGCKSRCRMCYFWKNKQFQHFNNVLLYDSVAEMYKENLRSLFFTGGECLIFAKDLFEISKKFHAEFVDLHLKINTNGLLVYQYAKEIAELFDTVVISLDAVNASTYRRIRGIDGLDTVIRGIDALRSIKPDIRISIRTLILPENLYELGDLIEFSVNKKIDKLSFKAEDLNTEFAFGRADSFATESLTLDFIHNLENEVDKLFRKYAQYFDSGNPLYEKGNDLKRVISIYKRDESIVSDCNCATHCCVIYPDATIAPCFFIESYGDISNGINKTFQSNYYQKTVRNILNEDKRYCRHCVCPVVFA